MDDPDWDYKTPRSGVNLSEVEDTKMEKRTENIARKLNGILCRLRDSNRRADSVLEYLIGPCPDDLKEVEPGSEHCMLDCIDISLHAIEQAVSEIEFNMSRFETI